MNIGEKQKVGKSKKKILKPDEQPIPFAIPVEEPGIPVEIPQPVEVPLQPAQQPSGG